MWLQHLYWTGLMRIKIGRSDMVTTDTFDWTDEEESGTSGEVTLD